MYKLTNITDLKILLNSNGIYLLTIVWSIDGSFFVFESGEKDISWNLHFSERKRKIF